MKGVKRYKLPVILKNAYEDVKNQLLDKSFKK